MRSQDTSASAEKVQSELLAKMSIQEKADLLININLTAYRMTIADIRRLHPKASDEEVLLHIARRRLGDELTLEVYGRLPADP